MIVRFNYLHLRRDEQLMFNDKALQIVIDCCGRNHKSIERFEEAAKHLSELLRVRAFKTPSVLAELDRKADQAWSSLNLQLKASMAHPLEETRRAAEQVYAVFSQTDNPTNLNYEQEYGALQRLLSQLETLPADSITKALVDLHLVALREAVDNFVTASKGEIREQVKQQAGEIKEAVNACKLAWTNVAKYVELTAQVDPSPEMEAALQQLNGLCSNYKRNIDTRKNNNGEIDTGFEI